MEGRLPLLLLIYETKDFAENLSEKLYPPENENVFRFKSVLGIIPFSFRLVYPNLKSDFSLLPDSETLLVNAVHVFRKFRRLSTSGSHIVGVIKEPAAAFKSPPVKSMTCPFNVLGELN